MKEDSLPHVLFSAMNSLARPFFALAAALILPALFPVSLAAHGLIIVDEPIVILPVPPPTPMPPYPHPHPPFPPHPPILPPWPRPPRPIHQLLPLDLERQQVNAKVTSQVAITEVRQIFRNPTSQRLQGTFIFPIPTGAHVSEFSMDINGEQVQAELLDAEKARRIYEDIVRRIQDPALFEYAGQQLFKVRIFPIEPGPKKEVHVRYTELLRKDGGIVRYVYPLSTAKHDRKTIPDFSLKLELEAGRDHVLKTVYSPSHEVEIARKGENRAVVGMEQGALKTEEDFVLYFSERTGGGAPVDLDFLTFHEDGSDKPGHFLVLLSPSAWEQQSKPMPKDVVFVFDTSGSMRGEKMEQAKKALIYCVDGLNEGDRFEVIRFSTETEPVFGELRDASKENRDKAKRFLDSVKPVGGTAIEEALTLAMRSASESSRKGRPADIIFLTDGLPTLGATSEEVILKSMLKAKKDGSEAVRVFCFGIGTSINTHLLDLITEETRAVSEYVLPDESLEEKVSRFFTKISDPVLTGLSLKFEGVDWVRERYPKDLPDLFRGEQLVVLGRYQRGRADGQLILSGKFGNEERVYHFPVELGRKGDGAEFIGRLWATRRVGYLLDQVRLHGENRELKDEIVELARKYGIVTPYTSYLIMEDEDRRNVPVQLRTQASKVQRLELETGAVRPSAASPMADLGGEYKAMKAEKDGGRAVAGAAAAKQLRESVHTATVSEANAVADRARGEAIQLAPSRNIAGKTFYWQSERWVDEEAQAAQKKQADRKVQFGSKEYFDLLSRNSAVAQWLSVGPEVQVVVGKELIEVVK